MFQRFYLIDTKRAKVTLSNLPNRYIPQGRKFILNRSPKPDIKARTKFYSPNPSPETIWKLSPWWAGRLITQNQFWEPIYRFNLEHPSIIRHPFEIILGRESINRDFFNSVMINWLKDFSNSYHVPLHQGSIDHVCNLKVCELSIFGYLWLEIRMQRYPIILLNINKLVIPNRPSYTFVQ